MKYQIISGNNLDALENGVNRWIKEGWRPQGGVCLVQFSPTTVKFYQAMVRPSAPDEAAAGAGEGK